MPDHDSLYHRLFDHPGMVIQLLREFVVEPWLDDLDLDGMERMNAKFHANTGERREGDMIWRIPLRKGGDAYLMLLLDDAPNDGLCRPAVAASGEHKQSACGCRKNCWRCGACWRHGQRTGSNSGCRKAAKKASLRVS